MWAVREGLPVTRAELVEYTLRTADQFSDLEEMERALFLAEQEISRGKRVPQELKERIAGLRQGLADQLRNAGAVVEALRQVVPESPTTNVRITPTVTVGQPFPHFLIAYQRSTGTLIECTGFDLHDMERIAARRTELEQQHGGADYEVVLIATHSEEDLLKTHARYFKNPEQLASKVSRENKN